MKKIVLLSVLLINMCFISPIKAEVSQNVLLLTPMTYDVTDVKKLRVLGVSKTNLNDPNLKVGGSFCAKIIPNLKSNGEIVVTGGSLLKGEITKINLPHRILNRDGYILVSIKEIETPQGKKKCLTTNFLAVKVTSAPTKTVERRTVEQGGPRILALGATLPLSIASSLNGGVIYAIGAGTSTILGGISGFCTPDFGKSRIQTAGKRAVETSPIGPVLGVFTKGYDTQINKDDYLWLELNNSALNNIRN